MSQNTKRSAKMFRGDGSCVWCLYLVYFLILLDLATRCTEAYGNPSSDFSKHSIVRPKFHHTRTKREITTTQDETGSHHPEVTLTVSIDGEEHELDLRLNEALVPRGHSLSYQQGGRTKVNVPEKEDLDICQYSGRVRGKPGSWAAVSTCHGVKGVIYDGRQLRYIEPAHDNDINADHFLYSHEHLAKEHRCGYEGGTTHNSSYDPMLFQQRTEELARKRSRVSRYKRDTYEDTLVREPYNADRRSRYVELVLVVDHGEFLASGGDLQLVHRQMKDLANIINSVYAPLNIFIALVGVEIWSENDEIVLEEDGDATLNKFLHYRKTVLVTRIPNDNAQLLTRQNFKAGVVGKALKGFMCSYNYSAGVATNHSRVIGLVAMTIAHEMGHNFGMEHDQEPDCECPDKKCIMSPSSTSVTPVHWSSCSLKSLALSFERGMDYCLRNKPKQLAESPTCGNGFLEEGEQCDCGTAPGASSPAAGDRAACTACCTPDCTLRANATCGHGQCCDLTTCRPKAAGTECRAADRECDLPEYCSGHSQFCPHDVHKMDATPCGREQAYCVRGSCRSHTDQCRLLWGVTGASSDDKCYNNSNIKGDDHGNCGYDRVNQIYRRCAPQDVMCGMLQCRHLNERLEFGMENAAVLTATFINNNGVIIPCRTVIIDLGLSDVDPGLVPDGAKCGPDKMCMQQKCVPVELVRAAMATREGSVCPSNCSGHGICNSNGNCHCEAGFAPPRCALPGAGGSYDSGPATDPSVQRNFMVVMYVIFLGIIPGTLLVLLLVYYSRHNVLLWWKKPRKSVQSPKSSLQHRISLGAHKLAANFTPQPAPPAPRADDMSSSLLADTSPPPLNPTVNFFGNFKGFSLTPIEKEEEKEQVKEPVKSAKITPVHRSGSNSNNLANQGVLKPVLRSAPPLPVVPNSPKTSPSIKRTGSSVQRIKALMNAEKEDSTPVMATPPPRPVISSPILEASTCTAKELISPLGSKTLGPVRAAPNVPTMSPDLPKRPLSMHASTVPQKPLPEEPKKVKEGISLNRIASFLKHDKPKEKERNPVERSHSLPKNPIHQIKVPKSVDKVALRNLQISNPILQKGIELPVATVPVVSDSEDAEDPKAFVNRTQSMRAAPVVPKAPLQTFGSMRQPSGAPRPISGVGRPTAPPPPAPIEETPVYQNPKPIDLKQTDYVDCIEEKQAPLAHIDEESGDNIYAIIEESPEKHSKPLPGVPPPIKTIPQAPPVGYNTPKPIPCNSGSTESMGLLGEIVDEIQNRNFDSIYSASTLRKKKGRAKENEGDRDSTYMNTAPESVYSNSGGKSVASTTSSGYLHPSAVNVPTYLNKDKVENKEEKAPPSPKANSKIPQFARQVTPPNLKTFKTVPQSPKATSKINQKITNSPDVVSSCAVADKAVKAPDVINNNKISDTPKVAAKPSITAKPNDNRPPLRPAPGVDKKPTVKPTLKPVTNIKPQINRTNSKVDSNIAAIADNINKNKPKVVPKPTGLQRTDSNVKPNASKLTSKPSNVASLQQKFENRKSIGKEPVAKK
ncbi:disintegrin and metalloproteinase domain-containing protein 12-like [Cydia splendana]|uniref:disintegrin and metalloproteinase domain-containing protein 12-like n=1 Tax=Cydia splendana TaxID=1100963 RepID=UPI0028F467B5